jgi:hypothetical protein
VRVHLTECSLSTHWLAQRLGVDSSRLNAMRRGGELLAVRAPGSQEYLYPAWQFAADGKPRAIVPRLMSTARERGFDETRLYELMNMRAGVGGVRLVDLLLEGRDEQVLAAIRSA